MSSKHSFFRVTFAIVIVRPLGISILQYYIRAFSFDDTGFVRMEEAKKKKQEK